MSKPVTISNASFAEKPIREVFSINFIRKELHYLRVSRILAYVAFISLAVNAVILVLMIAMSYYNHSKSSSLEDALKNQVSSKTDLKNLVPELELIKKQASDNLRRMNSIITLQKNKFATAEKLAGLSRTLPPATWITHLDTDRSARTIAIQATYIVEPNHPYQVPIKQWIEALKADPGFGRDLKNIELKQSSQKMQEQVEVCIFELLAQWKSAPETDAGKHD